MVYVVEGQNEDAYDAAYAIGGWPAVEAMLRRPEDGKGPR